MMVLSFGVFFKHVHLSTYTNTQVHILTHVMCTYTHEYFSCAYHFAIITTDLQTLFTKT